MTHIRYRVRGVTESQLTQLLAYLNQLELSVVALFADCRYSLPNRSLKLALQGLGHRCVSPCHIDERLLNRPSSLRYTGSFLVGQFGAQLIS